MQEDTDNQSYPDIPGYKILSELGRGGIATVYLAVQESLDRQVALKVMSPLLAMEPDYAERFIREGRTVAQLSHSNIITVYDIGLQKHQLFIAMEHISGGNMRSLMQDHTNDPEWALSIAGQIALALGYAHTVGIVHRDVKPENILFRENGSAVLTDFGIAKTISSNTNLTRAGTIIGTPKYMSPEQTDGLGNDPRTDIYSLGIILYEMLTGNVPYDSENSMAVLYAHVHSPIPDLPEELADLQPLLNNLLAKKAEDRAEDCDELAEIIRITRRERHYALKDPVRMQEVNRTRELKKNAQLESLQEDKENSSSELISSIWGKLTVFIQPAREFLSTWINNDADNKKLNIGIAAALVAGLLILITVTSSNDSEGELNKEKTQKIVSKPAEETKNKPTLTAPNTSTANLSSTTLSAEKQVSATESLNNDNTNSQIVDNSEDEIGTPAPNVSTSEKEKGNQAALLLSLFLADESNDELVKQHQAIAPEKEVVKKPKTSQKQIKINRLLTQARKAVKDGNISTPVNTNAISYYHQALELSPNNRRALRGLGVSGDLMAVNIKEKYPSGKQDLALQAVNSALLKIPGHKNLTALRATIEATFNPNSSYAIAEKLYRGVNGPQNSSRAAFYYKKAAELGHIQAMNNLGVAYADGDGIFNSDSLAMKWFEKSAKLGNSEAMYNLALGYHFSGKPQADKAMPWVSKAAAAKYRPAYTLIGWMITTGTGTKASRVKAIKWDLKGMVNPISSTLHSQYRIPRKWQDDFIVKYKAATNTGA